MAPIVVSNWWTFLLRGLVAIAFGSLALLMPWVTLTSVILVFGGFAVVDGALNVASALVRGSDAQEPWWVLLVHGLTGLMAGVLLFLFPGLTAVALTLLIAAWAVVTGALEIGAAIRLRRHISGEWLLGLAGALSVVLGLVLALFPEAGASGLMMVVGAWAVGFGVVLITLGLRLRRVVRERDLDRGVDRWAAPGPLAP